MKPRLAVIAPNFTSPFIASILDHLKHLSSTPIIARIAKGDLDVEPTRTALSLIKNGDAPTALIVISMRPSTELLARMRALNITVVLVDEQADRCASVACDNEKGGYLAGKHLAERGHHNIALVTGKLGLPGSKNADDRAAGFRRALAEAHLGLLNVDCWQVINYDQADGIEWHRHRGPDTTAVFCAAGDLCASGILKVAPELGLKVPKDLAVVGFDDSPAAGILGLTTIRQPIKAMSEAAYRMAVIEPSRTLARPDRVVLAPELVLRGTT